MEFQHINVKLYLDDSSALNLEELVPVFHGWIQGQVCDELLIDVADYRHVHAGPGVVLIGHEADYGVDQTGNRLGVRYNRKALVPGSNRDRLAQALRSALRACLRLESDERLQGKLRFGRRELKVFVNDRMLAPNNKATYAAFEEELRSFLGEAAQSNDFQVFPETEPRRLFGVDVRFVRPLDPAEVLQRLSS